MGARGVARADRPLHWLLMRPALGWAKPPLAARPNPVRRQPATWLESDVLAVATYTAFLSRIVPHADSTARARPGTTEALLTWEPSRG